MVRRTLVLLSSLILVSAGCSQQQLTGEPPATVLAEPSGEFHHYWQGVRFKIPWDADAPRPRTELDLLLAHRVVGPIIEAHRHDIAAWRFHRRWGRDETGHQFSWLFYASPDTARRIGTELAADGFLAQLKKSRLIESVRYENVGDTLGATSDGRWPAAIQEAWPVFAQGASEMWLRLIAAAIKNKDDKNQSIKWVVQRYEAADGELRQLWKRYGQHAFLHHLNALFGYEPLVIYTETQF